MERDRRASAAARSSRETCTEDAGYLDPLMSGRGPRRHRRDDRGAPSSSSRATASSSRSEPDAHHDRVRFTWNLSHGADPADAPVAVGIDFATLAEDGRLRSVTGFLEAVA